MDNDELEAIKTALDRLMTLEEERPKMIEMMWSQHHLWMTELINRAVREGYSGEDVGWVMTPKEKEANRKFMFLMTALTNPHLSQNGSEKET